MATITSPDPYYFGTVGVAAQQVTFRHGVAETDNEAVIAFCRAAGYQIDDSPADVEAATSMPAANASQEAWADWVIESVDGVDPEQVRALRRDELREQYGS
jgi:hypothetical protein